jgi:hypothetical protein
VGKGCRVTSSRAVDLREVIIQDRLDAGGFVAERSVFWVHHREHQVSRLAIQQSSGSGRSTLDSTGIVHMVTVTLIQLPLRGCEAKWEALRLKPADGLIAAFTDCSEQLQCGCRTGDAYAWEESVPEVTDECGTRSAWLHQLTPYQASEKSQLRDARRKGEEAAGSPTGSLAGPRADGHQYQTKEGIVGCVHQLPGGPGFSGRCAQVDDGRLNRR